MHGGINRSMTRYRMINTVTGTKSDYGDGDVVKSEVFSKAHMYQKAGYNTETFECINGPVIKIKDEAGGSVGLIFSVEEDDYIVAPEDCFLPQPVIRDRKKMYGADTPYTTWLGKLREELEEVAIEAAGGNIGALVEELQDIIHVATTWQAKLGFGASARRQICQMVNQKNAKRGYFDIKGCELAYDVKEGMVITGVRRTRND